jgi:TolA-binding protein
MLRSLVAHVFVFLLALSCARCWAQQAPTSPTQDKGAQNSPADVSREAEESSSKDTRIDLGAPEGDAKNHPQSGAAMMDAEGPPSDVQELQPWDPHKAAKDIEVGDFYYRKKNYRAAGSRYKEALTYKPNDAVANFRLAECEEKTGDTADAVTHYRAYLKILPEGPLAQDAQKALERLGAGNKQDSANK